MHSISFLTLPVRESLHATVMDTHMLTYMQKCKDSDVNIALCIHFPLDSSPMCHMSISGRLNICCCSLTHTLPPLLLKNAFPLPRDEFIIHHLSSHHLLSQTHLLPAFSGLNPTITPIHLIIFLCHPSLHVPFNYRAQYHSFDRLSISSICPDYSLKIKKIAMDQSK